MKFKYTRHSTIFIEFLSATKISHYIPDLCVSINVEEKETYAHAFGFVLCLLKFKDTKKMHMVLEFRVSNKRPPVIIFPFDLSSS